MPLELLSVRPDHLPHLARICHQAFNGLHEKHDVPRDVPTEEVGQLIIEGVAHRADYTGVAAVLDGQIVGSNFLLHADHVAGVGPITVDPACQTRGIGRALMQWVVDEAARRNLTQVRLFQEAINTTSLSLYTRIGFTWRYAAALMQPAPADQPDPSIRPMTTADLPAVAALSTAHYGHSRANDAAQLLAMNMPAFIRHNNAIITGYQIASLFGHAAANSIDDLIALAQHTAAHVPPPMAVVIVPLDHPQLFNAALHAGFHSRKVLNCMAWGSYTPPPGHHLPSIQC